MSKYEKCFICGKPIIRGYPMVDKEGNDVVICEFCKMLWRKAKAEKQAKGADNETD